MNRTGTLPDLATPSNLRTIFLPGSFPTEAYAPERDKLNLIVLPILEIGPFPVLISVLPIRLRLVVSTILVGPATLL